jgi:hypothetical protein
MTIKIKERRASFSLKYQDNTGTNVIVKTSENKNRTHFFRIRIHKFFLSDSVSDPDPSTNIVTQNFFIMPLIAFICVLESVRQRKKFSNFKTHPVRFFSLSMFDLRFFQKKNYLQQGLDPNPNPNFFSDSDPAKTFELFRIRIHNTDKNHNRHKSIKSITINKNKTA